MFGLQLTSLQAIVFSTGHIAHADAMHSSFHKVLGCTTFGMHSVDGIAVSSQAGARALHGDSHATILIVSETNAHIQYFMSGSASLPSIEGGNGELQLCLCDPRLTTSHRME